MQRNLIRQGRRKGLKSQRVKKATKQKQFLLTPFKSFNTFGRKSAKEKLISATLQRAGKSLYSYYYWVKRLYNVALDVQNPDWRILQ